MRSQSTNGGPRGSGTRPESCRRGEAVPGADERRRPRKALETALDFLRAGDVLAVTKLDRLARSIRNLCDIVERKSRSRMTAEDAALPEPQPMRHNRHSRSRIGALQPLHPVGADFDCAPSQKQHAPVEERGLCFPAPGPMRCDAHRLTFGEGPACDSSTRSSSSTLRTRAGAFKGRPSHWRR